MDWPGGIAAITLFVEDLESAKRFYEDVFQLPVDFEDDNSAVFKFGETLVNLLRVSEAPGLIAPCARSDGRCRRQLPVHARGRRRRRNMRPVARTRRRVAQRADEQALGIRTRELP